jgi:hypothetical protein
MADHKDADATEAELRLHHPVLREICGGKRYVQAEELAKQLMADPAKLLRYVLSERPADTSGVTHDAVRVGCSFPVELQKPNGDSFVVSMDATINDVDDLMTEIEHVDGMPLHEQQLIPISSSSALAPETVVALCPGEKLSGACTLLLMRITNANSTPCTTCGCSSEHDKWGDRKCFCDTCQLTGCNCGGPDAADTPDDDVLHKSTLRVSNISLRTTEGYLRTHFGAHGIIQRCNVVINSGYGVHTDANKAMGCALITFRLHTDAHKAMSELQGYTQPMGQHTWSIEWAP